jgi:dihydrofolate reductase
MPKISMIVAMDEKRGIGLKNGLPAWSAPGDLKRFKALTTGTIIVMGRKTWEGLGKPLPGRVNVVMSKEPHYYTESGDNGVGPYWANTSYIKWLPSDFEDKDVFIIGGAQIYEQCFPMVDKLYITEVKGEFEADTFFPDFDKTEWKLVEKEELPTHSYLTYERIKKVCKLVEWAE